MLVSLHIRKDVGTAKRSGDPEDHQPTWIGVRLTLVYSESCQRDVPDIPRGELAASVPSAGKFPNIADSEQDLRPSWPHAVLRVC